MTLTFNDLYAHELEMLASAETQMVKILPKLAEGTDTKELKTAFLSQVAGCEEQLALIKELLKALERPRAVPVSRGIRSLLKECLELLKSFPTGTLRDAVMIAHVQRAEHYKMAAYESVQQFAALLGDKEGSERLSQAGKDVTIVQKSLRAIAIQVNAEAYVDTRVEGP